MEAIVGAVAGSIGAAIALGKCMYAPIKRQVNYLCCFNNNVENLKDEARKLEQRRDGLQMRIDTEVNNAQVILPEVKAWIEDATRARKEVIEAETEITTTRNGGSTLKPHYSLSRKVKKTAEAIKELREKCHFNIISQLPPPTALVSAPLGPYSEFESRKYIEESIMTSLRDNGIYKVGICGMGGVGKTTMAKKIMDQVREERLFEEISMVVVSQTANPLRIQKSLAESLGLKLDDESLPARAHRLRTRLSESKKRSLIVVDDVWENLSLEEIGIPCNSQCKVLLTSRSHDVLRRMNAENVHAVNVLSEKEAWDLFTLHVGNCIEHQNLMSVAQEVATECKGLPIALVTLGASHKDVGEARVWKDLLHRLKSNNSFGFPEFFKHVFMPLHLSYDHLENEEAQSLFLLCCLYHEDEDIPLKQLAFYAKGLQMLRGIKSLEEARNRVYSLIQMLKSCFLLLEGKNRDHVKMHDVVRELAIFIASKKKLITSDSETNDCTWISPHIGEIIEVHTGSRIFPNLRLLWIDCSSGVQEWGIKSEFLEGTKQLNVLSIRSASLEQLFQTTRILVNLQTLVLERCWALESMSAISELINLEILICRRCYYRESLPMEIGKLRRLRLLELSDCKGLKTIEPGIISNLEGLEELIVVGSFDDWQAENLEKGKRNAFLSELEKLSNLSRLKIEIKDSTLAIQHISLSSNMVGYHIRIGETHEFNRSMIYEKIMELVLPANISLGKGFVKCFGSVEEIYLKGDGSSLDFGIAKKVKVLIIKESSTVKKLVNRKTAHIVFPLLEVLKLEQLSELKEICDMDGPVPSNFLRNLRELKLQDLPALEHLNVVSNLNKLSILYAYKCNGLKSLFSSLTMTSYSSLAQLKSLEIECCDMMEQVFLWNNEENQLPLVFANLKLLKLQFLPKLTSFSKGIGSIEFPVLEELEVVECPVKNFVLTTSTEDYDAIHVFCKHDKVKFDCLKKLKFIADTDETGEIWCPQIQLNFFFPRLRELQLYGLKGLKSLFSLSTTESDCLSQLERLEICCCGMMEEVILWNECETNHHIIFSKLKFLGLSHLPRLTSFSQGIESMKLPLLEEIHVSNCPITTFVSMDSSTTCSNHDDDTIHLFCKSNQVEFSNLQTLAIFRYYGGSRYWCPQLPMIDIFSGLSKLCIFEIAGIKSLFSCSVAQNLQNMRALYIRSCYEMVRVIEDDACDDETPPFHFFSNLEQLELVALPRLKSFCEWRCALEFPLLKTLTISGCAMMEKFTSGPLHTPVLKYIGQHWKPKLEVVNDDVNTFLQQRFLKTKEEQEQRYQRL